MYPFNPYNMPSMVPGVTPTPVASTTAPEASTDVTTPFDVHKAGLAKLHQSEEFSDCKIICGPYHFKLHKVILASHSDYFKTAFKTGTFKEGSCGTIELKAIQNDSEYFSEAEDVCDDPEIVKLMVEYFYHYDYPRNADPVPVQDDVQPTMPAVLAYQSAQSNANAVLHAVSGGQYGNANAVAAVSSPRRS